MAEEIRNLGGEVERKLTWGDLAEIYSWPTVLFVEPTGQPFALPLHESQVDNVDEMYQAALSVDWPEIFAEIDLSHRLSRPVFFYQ